MSAAERNGARAALRAQAESVPGAAGADVRSRERMLRELPSVDALAAQLAAEAVASHAEAVAVARAALAERRSLLLRGQTPEGDVLAAARARLRPSLRRVLNGTGVVIHTNLGRAPLPAAAAAAVAAESCGYSNLELDLRSGRRGSREQHVRGLLCELTGAEDALAVNNGAGAALLALAALAGDGQTVAVSRGQLVEIGGGFRIPDVLARAGAQIVEVGTTNRTRLADYRTALGEHGASVILRVHQSNFRTVGFVEQVEIEQLCALGVPVIDDVGSGLLAEGLAVAADEPPVRRSVAAGAALVVFSADKLLGGPQGGLLVGGSEHVQRARRHPLARALRIGRLPLAALAATLALYRDPERALAEIPVLAMLAARPAALERRAELLAACGAGEIVRASGRVGGGALPLAELEGPVLALQAPAGAEALAAALRAGEPPLLARISGERVIVDPRTLTDEETEMARSAIERALARLDDG